MSFCVFNFVLSYTVIIIMYEKKISYIYLNSFWLYLQELQVVDSGHQLLLLHWSMMHFKLPYRLMKIQKNGNTGCGEEAMWGHWVGHCPLTTAQKRLMNHYHSVFLVLQTLCFFRINFKQLRTRPFILPKLIVIALSSELAIYSIKPHVKPPYQ